MIPRKSQYPKNSNLNLPNILLRNLSNMDTLHSNANLRMLLIKFSKVNKNKKKELENLLNLTKGPTTFHSLIRILSAIKMYVVIIAPFILKLVAYALKK